jgi:hypothetical protein
MCIVVVVMQREDLRDEGKGSLQRCSLQGRPTGVIASDDGPIQRVSHIWMP